MKSLKMVQICGCHIKQNSKSPVTPHTKDVALCLLVSGLGNNYWTLFQDVLTFSQGQQMFTVKSQIANLWGFAGHKVSVIATPVCQYRVKADVHGHVPVKLYLKNSATFGPGAICCLSHCNMEMMNPGLGPLLSSLSRAHLSSTETLWTLSPHSAVTCCLGIKAPLKGTLLIFKVFLFQTLLQCGPCTLHDRSWAWGGWVWKVVFLHLQPWGLV